jgi:hypothetical protein
VLVVSLLIMCFSYHVLVKLQSHIGSSCQHLSIFAWLIMLKACKLTSSQVVFLYTTRNTVIGCTLSEAVLYEP